MHFCSQAVLHQDVAARNIVGVLSSRPSSAARASVCYLACMYLLFTQSWRGSTWPAMHCVRRCVPDHEGAAAAW
jgi:hypothetical protein